jgi:hypothetical protein
MSNHYSAESKTKVVLSALKKEMPAEGRRELTKFRPM